MSYDRTSLAHECIDGFNETLHHYIHDDKALIGGPWPQNVVMHTAFRFEVAHIVVPLVDKTIQRVMDESDDLLRHSIPARHVPVLRQLARRTANSPQWFELSTLTTNTAIADNEDLPVMQSATPSEQRYQLRIMAASSAAALINHYADTLELMHAAHTQAVLF